jgi:uncharacterized membrane protein
MARSKQAVRPAMEEALTGALPRSLGDLMGTAVNLWPLIGVAVIIVGFILRFNPMLIVAAAAIITGLAAHFPIDRILTAIGTGFLKTRNIPLIILLPLAVIGLLERHGLRESGFQASRRQPLDVC